MLETLMKMGSVQENYKVIDDYGSYMRTIEALIIDDADIQEKAIELADELELNYFYEEEGFFVVELSDYSKRETNKNPKEEKEMETTVKVMYENILVGEVYTNRSLSVDEALELIGFDEAKFLAEQGFDGIDYNDFKLIY